MAVSAKAKRLFETVFETPELLAANMISNIQEWKHLEKSRNKKFRLTKEQKRQIKEFWKPYCRVSTKWAAYYSAQTGEFDPRYIPNTLYYTKIDQHFNMRKLGYGFNDKNYYSLIFAGIKQPETLVRVINGLLFDGEYNLISRERALELIKSEPEVIAKPSRESGSGRGIGFFNTSSDMSAIGDVLDSKGTDGSMIIQKIITQHPDLNKIHESSVNSVRVTSLLTKDGVQILSSVLRMGVDKSRVDNATAGGLSCGINEDGTLKKYARTYYTGETTAVHPQGVVFENYAVPSYDRIVEMVKKAAALIGNFRLVSWDIAVDGEGDPVLIEANMRKGGINLQQFGNGPLFGDLTKDVLDEVFGKKES